MIGSGIMGARMACHLGKTGLEALLSKYFNTPLEKSYRRVSQKKGFIDKALKP